MSKFKSIIFITCHIFFLAQFCLGDDGFEEKVNNLEESDQQKEKRIADLETKNIELITELQNLGIQFEQSQKNNLNESSLAQRIANLEATNIELITELQNLGIQFELQKLDIKVKDTSEDNSQTLLIVLIFVVILILILAFIVAFIWFKRKKEKESITTEPEAGEVTSDDKNQPKPEPQPVIVNTENDFEQQSTDESDVKKDDDYKEVSAEALCLNSNTASLEFRPYSAFNFGGLNQRPKAENFPFWPEALKKKEVV